ncbi:hypothetical protein CSC17_5308 [Klebsiella oxytoca]|nr:hypothetical protein CSC17_5308 [Klebsiella oxytoca]
MQELHVLGSSLHLALSPASGTFDLIPALPVLFGWTNYAIENNLSQ